MSEEKLDLSKVSVTDLFSDAGPADVPTTEDTSQDTDTADVDAAEEADTTDDVDTADTTDTSADEPDTSSDDDTAEDLDTADASAEEADEESIITELQAKLGYDLEGEFEESIDGLTEFTKATAEKMAQEQMQNVFSAFPDVQEYLNYRANGGDPKNYFQTAAPEVDYTTLEITSEDTTTQKKVVGEFLRAQGFENDEITETLEDYEDAGILERHAKKALTRLKSDQVKRKEQLIKEQQAQAEQQAQENERMWNEISSTINEGSLKGITVPERDKKRFFDWMASPIDREGNSQRSIDRAKLDQETLLALEYIVYKGFDLSKLIASGATTQKAKSLRSKLSKGSSTTSRMKSSKPGYTKAQKLPGLNELL